jgi:hypothetical protein
MFAWYEASETPGIATVGITGPTGYGFTLTGPWQQTATSTGLGLLKQTLTLPAGSQFTITSPQGVELPLLANGQIQITTRSNRFGRDVGEVIGNAINFPVSLAVAPINDLLADVFGSSFATVGILTSEWRISLGGGVYKILGTRGDSTDKIDQLLPGAPYLRSFGVSGVDARLGGVRLDYTQTPVHLIVDPADPMLFVKVPEDPLGAFQGAALAVSMHGLLGFKPQDAPDPQVDAGVTEFWGHVHATAELKIRPLPVDIDSHVVLDLEADVVVNVDADRDGAFLGGLRDVQNVFDILQGDFSAVRDVLHDIQLGANGLVSVTLESDVLGTDLTMGPGQASVVLNGLAESVWVRGEIGGDASNPGSGTVFAGSPLEIGGSIVYEGLLDFGGEFLYAVTTSVNAAGSELAYKFTISNEGISARVTGKRVWSATINYAAGTVSGKAIAEFEANIDIEFDDDGDVHLSGSVSASGKLRYQGTNLFSGSIDASVRSRGFRFRFPRGVGSIDLNLF